MGKKKKKKAQLLQAKHRWAEISDLKSVVLLFPDPYPLIRTNILPALAMQNPHEKWRREKERDNSWRARKNPMFSASFLRRNPNF